MHSLQPVLLILIRLYFLKTFWLPLYSNCRDWNCLGPKTFLGSNANGPNNKFLESGRKNWIYPGRKTILFNVLRQISWSIVHYLPFLSLFLSLVWSFLKVILSKSSKNPIPLSMQSSMLYTALLVSSSSYTCRLDLNDFFLSHPTLPGTIKQ